MSALTLTSSLVRYIGKKDHMKKRDVESETFVYLLDKPLCVDRTDIEALVRESALRKKHKPAEMSFSALMQSLTSPVGGQ